MEFAIVTPVAYASGTAVAVVVAAAVCLVARRAPGRWVVVTSWLLGLVLLADAVSWIVSEVIAGTFSAETSLPLALCNVVLIVAAVALLWPVALLVELTYYLGLTGTLLAVVTPDLSAGFPHLVFFQFLVGHCGVVIAALFLVVGRRMHPRRGAVTRTVVVTATYTALVGAVDAATGANYMFLRRPPSEWTPLRLFGPWPYYVGTSVVVGYLLFSLLNLPFRDEQRREGPRSAHRAGHAGRDPVDRDGSDDA